MEAKREKPSYSLANNLKFIFTSMWGINKRQSIFAFLRTPFVVATPFLGIYLSKLVVAAVTDGKSMQELLIVIAAISAVIMLSMLIENYLSAQLESFMMQNDGSYQTMIFSKLLCCDYEHVESPSGLTRLSKALDNVGSDNRGARLIVNLLSSVTANIIGVISYATILLALSPWILAVLMVTTVAGFFVLRLATAWWFKHQDNWKVLDRKLGYLQNNAGDFSRAKDMRLYHMVDWFRDVFFNTISDRMEWHKKEHIYGFKVDAGGVLLSLVREGFSYCFLVYLLYAKGLSVSDFVLYFGLITGFSTWLSGIANDCDRIYNFQLGFCDIRTFLDCPDKSNNGLGKPVPTETFSIEFRNVSYQYEGSDRKVIDGLSFYIPKGEKLAIVGNNGAGKTTLVKLLCGLYNPTEGQILIDGLPVSAYNRDEYFNLFAAVFQDIFMTPMSIAENIATSGDIDRQRIEQVLELAGLEAKLKSLPQGLDTRLIKSVYDDAVDLSGGEMQKLALARALYKDAKALVLDEPTAALDPIAESNIYTQYNQMSAGRTSIFISHRLASTRFCDRIFFIENGAIAESGSHDELMAMGFKYYEMFEIQSHYYREGVSEND